MRCLKVGTDTIASDFLTGNLLARGRLRYLFVMPRLVSYRIHDRDDGLFDAVAMVNVDVDVEDALVYTEQLENAEHDVCESAPGIVATMDR